jgi:hypothetical protein
MADHIIKPQTAHLNFSPVGFRFTARDCLDCLESYNPAKFSATKYFLACRAIELGLKALHLDTKDRAFVKSKLSHDLVKSYSRLAPGNQILTREECEVLKKANELYVDKAFEYVQVVHAFHAYKDFPVWDDLHALAIRVVEHVEEFQKANP